MPSLNNPMPGYPANHPKAIKSALLRRQQSGKLLNVGRLSTLTDVQCMFIMSADHAGVDRRLERHGNALTLRIGGAH